MECKLDWLSFTWKSGNIFSETEFEDFLKVFPEINDILTECIIVKDTVGGRGTFYDLVLGFNDFFTVSYNRFPLGGDNKDVNMGVNVSIPAHGLEYFFSKFSLSCNDAISMIRILNDRGCQFSRLDFAFDDFSKTYYPSDFSFWWGNIQQWKKHGKDCEVIVSKCKSGKLYWSRQSGGDTFYLGSRDNGKLLRIYDKDFESHGEIPAIRYEFELHTKYTANVVNYLLCNNRCPSFREFVEQFIIDIVFVKGGQTKQNGKSIQEWQDFVNDSSNPPLTQSLQLVATKAADCDNPIKRKFRYYKNNVFKRLAEFSHVLGDDRLIQMIHDCEDTSLEDSYFLHFYHNHKEELEPLLHNDWKSFVNKVS